MTDARLKEKYMEYQFLMQQLQQLQQNVSALEKHISDLNSLGENLNELKKTKLDSDMLMPLGSGIFIKGELKNNKEVIMNVGNSVCVEKTIDEAGDTVNKQLQEVIEVLEQLKEEINSTVEKLEVLQHEFEHMKPPEE